MVTAILFVNQAAPTTITQFHDMIMNQLPETILPSWEFELGIFLNNKYSKPTDLNLQNISNRYLYTLQLSYLNDEKGGNRMISIINNNKSVITCVSNSTNLENSSNNSHNNSSESDRDKEKDFDKIKENKKREKLMNHIKNGCCNNLNENTNENLEFLLVSKLQSLWTLKQTIKGQGGIGYIINIEINDEEGNKSFEKFKLRTSNCLLHGSFKGFLIEIEHLDNDIKSINNDKNKLILRFSRSISMIKNLIEIYKFPEGNLCFNVLSDSKLDYLSDLCQQYCDALQF